MKSVAVFMPGRLQSERLPDKLLLDIDGECLWEKACKKLAVVQACGIPTYALCRDEQLIAIAKKYDIKVIYRSEKSIMCDGPLNTIFGDIKNIREDYVMFFNPCCYSIKAATIISRINEFKSSQYDCATSVKPFKNWLYQWDGADTLYDIIEPNIYYSTKDIEDVWQPAHVFHIYNKKFMLSTGIMFNENIQLLPIDDSECLDVDTKEDFEYCRWYYEQRS